MLADFLFRKHLEDDETLVRVVHKHWFLGLKNLLMPTMIFALFVVLLALRHGRPFVLGVSLAEMMVVVWWIRNFLDYYLDAWIITDQGIIDVEWQGWFQRESTRVLYSDIQGISYKIKGVWGTLLTFGTVNIEKISTGAEISLPNVKHPRSVETTVLRCMEDYLQSKNLKNSKQLQELLATLLAERLQLQELEERVIE